MLLTLHHLHKSQSERIIFLLEELALPYTLVLHDRNPTTAFAPDSLKSVHPAGTAPVLIDDLPNPCNERIVLAESGACVEYILAVYAADSNLVVKPGQAGYGDYLAWLHAANGTLQPTLGRLMMFARLGVPEDNPMHAFVSFKLEKTLKQMDAQLGRTGAYLAGKDFTAADAMCFFTLTTMRGFATVDLGAYGNVLGYLERVSGREAYKRTMEKGDQGLVPLLGARVEKFEFGAQKAKA